jgi:neutral amino acid transport system ATP-binding protein
MVSGSASSAFPPHGQLLDRIRSSTRDVVELDTFAASGALFGQTTPAHFLLIGVAYQLVERGSITALIGPNGAGKSSLFNVVSGFERADGGAVRLDGRSIYRLPAYSIARRGMVRTFQLTKTLSVMSVLDNMLLAAPRHPGERLGGSFVRPLAARRREREARARALELLKTFDLGGLAGDYAGTLSGGQRKLLELARALMLEPRLVLLDEPLAGVNPTLGRRLLDHIEELRRRD